MFLFILKGAVWSFCHLIHFKYMLNSIFLKLTFLIQFTFIFHSLLDNKSSGALTFFQRQFWSCVKVLLSSSCCLNNLVLATITAINAFREVPRIAKRHSENS